MDYVLLKQVHISLAVISIAGFILRWGWSMRGSTLAHHRLTRIAPHAVDTLFLTSALLLAYTIGQYPFTSGWLTAKVFGLLAYILLGMTAMSARISIAGRILGFLAALCCFAWIVSVACLKSPWGLMG